MTDASRITSDARRSIRDRLRINSYLMRLDWYLEGILRGADRLATIKSLRQELTTDPRELTNALTDLGPPNVLASRYSDEGERRPLWSIGIITGGIVLLAYWAVFLSYAGGMLAAVDSNALTEAHSTFLFIQVEVFSNTEGFGIGWANRWVWLVVPAAIIVAAFLTGSRSWRALRRHRSFA